MRHSAEIHFNTGGAWSPWAIFGVITAAVVAGSVLMWVIGMAGLGAMLSGFNEGAEQQAAIAAHEAILAAAERPMITERVVSVPSRSVEECLGLTRGEVNEYFAKCRRGHQYIQRTTK